MGLSQREIEEAKAAVWAAVEVGLIILAPLQSQATENARERKHRQLFAENRGERFQIHPIRPLHQMTEIEEQQLRQLGEDIAGATNSRWQPRCIARAFSGRASEALRFTMQTWIDLELAQSPLLLGKLPQTLDELETALRAFGWSHSVEVNVEDAVALAERMRELITEAFALALPMTPPGPTQQRSDIDGFGTWLPLWACLIVQARLSPQAARDIEVGQAYALIAAMRRNQGWQIAGTPYALRDAAEGLNSHQPNSTQ